MAQSYYYIRGEVQVKKIINKQSKNFNYVKLLEIRILTEYEILY